MKTKYGCPECQSTMATQIVVISDEVESTGAFDDDGRFLDNGDDEITNREWTEDSKPLYRCLDCGH